METWTPFIGAKAAQKAAERYLEKNAKRIARATFGVRRYRDPDDRMVRQGICVRLYSPRGEFVGCL